MSQSEQQDFLLSTFREEIDGHTVNLTRGLVEIEEGDEGPALDERMRELMRLLHTVKGASRMMGFANISKIAHAMEDVVGYYRENGPKIFPREAIDLLFDGIDMIAEMVRIATRRPDAPPLPPNPLVSIEGQAGLLFKLNQQAGKSSTIEELVESLNGTSSTSSNSNSNGSHPQKNALELPPLKPEETTLEKAERVLDPTAATSGTNERSTDETIRVRLDKLDGLINLAGELVINKIQNEEHLAAIHDLLQLSRRRGRVANQLREFLIEQTPVEERSRLLGLTELFSFEQAELPSWILPTLAKETLAKGNGNLTKATNPNATAITAEVGLDAKALRKIFDKLEEMIAADTQIEQGLTKMVRERKTFNLRFGSAADELRRNMLGIRMLPLDSIFGRFARPVRDLANERGKQVRILVSGGAIEVDKRILEEITDPLMHILRNAVDHAIEPPQERRMLGKPEEGTIRLNAMQKGSHVLIQIHDDGAGIDPARLREAAAAKGIYTHLEAANLSDETALDLIFRPGFSIRARPDEISGRGVGMDVVQQNTKKLNGRVSVQTKVGQGTTFTMEIPLTLATVDALLVRVAGQIFAMPSVMVSGTIRVNRDEVYKVEGRDVLRLQGQLVPLVKLTKLLAINHLNQESKHDEFDHNIIHGVLVSAGVGGANDGNIGASSERFICYEVDELVDEREVVVKGLGAFLEKTPNIAGASVLGADGLALILDVFGLVQSVRQGISTHTSNYTPPPVNDFFISKRTRHILVVDDSLATRELERSILETAGYKVTTARDGVEGLAMAREQRPDLVLSDVEMPNMDGFRLCSALKQDSRLNDLPVIIVSSRDSEEDRRKGLQAGAQAYIVKGQFEQTKLLDTISRLIV
ncbi:MAG: hybrid sensor histidine kinase/response regulator [Chloroflexi bacterium]|nr:hybrid sensor histidine kinase/response regulator [Chloroflexota bacterium]